MKQNYELTYLISSLLPEQEAGNISVGINNFIQEKQGLVNEGGLPRTIGLAYPIKKENNAWLQTTNFSLEKAELQELEKKLKENKEILRFLILKKVKERKRAIRRIPKMVIKKTQEAVPASPFQKAELEDIGKKLDEILQ